MSSRPAGPVGRLLMDELEFTDAEKEFVEQATTGTTADMNRSRVIVDVYLVKRLKTIGDDLIESNTTISETSQASATEVSEANRRSANSLNFLTGALVLVGLAQVLAVVFG